MENSNQSPENEHFSTIQAIEINPPRTIAYVSGKSKNKSKVPILKYCFSFNNFVGTKIFIIFHFAIVF